MVGRSDEVFDAESGIEISHVFAAKVGGVVADDHLRSAVFADEFVDENSGCCRGSESLNGNGDDPASEEADDEEDVFEVI